MGGDFRGQQGVLAGLKLPSSARVVGVLNSARFRQQADLLKPPNVSLRVALSYAERVSDLATAPFDRSVLRGQRAKSDELLLLPRIELLPAGMLLDLL